MRPALLVLVLSILALPASAQERSIEMRDALVSLARVLGESHALRQVCEGNEDQFWRSRMNRLASASASCSFSGRGPCSQTSRSAAAGIPVTS